MCLGGLGCGLGPEMPGGMVFDVQHKTYRPPNQQAYN